MPVKGCKEGNLTRVDLRGLKNIDTGHTWTAKVCKIMGFMAVIMGLVLLFYILLGLRYKQGSGELGISFQR